MSSKTPLNAINALNALNAPSLVKRLACWLYEGLLLFALMMVAVLIQSALAVLLPALNHPALLQATTFLLWGAYFIWFWQHGGQTLPMKTWRIRIVSSSGAPLNRIRALSRYALAWVWGLPLGLQISPWALNLNTFFILQSAWVLFWALLSQAHPQRQFWHDAMAGTRLIAAT